LLRKCVVVFIDDVLVYSATLEDHVRHLTQVFELLSQQKLHLKQSKCLFAQEKLEFLGHIVSAAGITTDPKKVEVIQNWPIPKSTKDVRSFLGMAGYYRKFVAHFGIISRPLTTLLKKDTIFVWTELADQSFNALKTALAQAPVLAIPNFSKSFTIETDASGGGVGAVLQQEGHPVAYISRALGPKNMGLSIYEKECLAILFAVEHWRPYLQHGEFIIKTDHQSLTHLDDQRLSTPWQQKALTKLLGLQYKIQYKQGSENRVADALSRRPNMDQDTANAHLNTVSMSTITPDWLLQVTQGYDQDPTAKKILTQLAVGGQLAHYTITQGVIRYKGRIWLGSNQEMHQKVMSALHDSAVGGHSGFPVTYRRIKSNFAWPGMKHQIREFVQGCQICQQAKPERVKYPGLLLPLPVPKQAWQTVSLDFISGLPPTGKGNCILVVVDKLSKYAHFMILKHPFTALTVAKTFLSEVYRLHGLPTAIISDRDPIFTSRLWQELFRLTGTQLCLSSSYHPQSDGQTERVNQCLETYLRCFVHSCPRQWPMWLSLAEFWYNTCHHSSLGKSPFEVLYGHLPTQVGLVAAEQCEVPDLQQFLEDRQKVLQQVRMHLQRAQARMKRQADQGRTERSFSVGDQVFLKLQPYCQSSITERQNQKLSFRFFGPYAIKRQINHVAYELALPAGSSIHPVFHVSQLKAVIRSRIPVSPVLPDLSHNLQVPVVVLDTRLRRQAGKVQNQLLIQWSGWHPTLATWEGESDIKRHFPFAPAWGQAGVSGGENVSVPADGDASASAGERWGMEPGVRVDGPRRSQRVTQPNVRLSGHEWVK
jgi:hypothetical protein